MIESQYAASPGKSVMRRHHTPQHLKAQQLGLNDNICDKGASYGEGHVYGL